MEMRLLESIKEDPSVEVVVEYKSTKEQKCQSRWLDPEEEKEMDSGSSDRATARQNVTGRGRETSEDPDTNPIKNLCLAEPCSMTLSNASEEIPTLRTKRRNTTTMEKKLKDMEIGCTSMASSAIRKAQHEQDSPKPRLTLSAFRRHPIRIADQDSERNLSDEYDLVKGTTGFLGHGAMSTVRMAIRRSDNTRVAVKCIQKHAMLGSRRWGGRNKNFLQEWQVLQILKDHPNVVSLIDVFETDDQVLLVMEYCKGGELFRAIQLRTDSPSVEAEAATIAWQILTVLKDMHQQGIVHGDVKPENILLTSLDGCEVKLCDFGVARMLDTDQSDTWSSDGDASPMTPSSRSRRYSTEGSDFYTAPEVRMRGGHYDTAMDVYSLGVTLYILLCGFPPSCEFQEVDDSDSDTVSFPPAFWSDKSSEAKRLITRMVDPDPESRITAAEALQDVWIRRFRRSCYLPSNKRSAVISPSKPRPVVDLELVRKRLFSQDPLVLDLPTPSSPISLPSNHRRKKRRLVRDGKSLIAMAELYEGVASAAASAMQAAAGVVYKDGRDLKVMDSTDDEGGDESSFVSTMTPYSV